MSQYFPKPYEPFGGDINVKVDLSNYANSNLASTKAEVDIDKLKSVLNDLAKLSNVVKMMLSKRQYIISWLQK